MKDKTRKGPNMKEKIIVIYMLVLCFILGHVATMYTMSIETDGNGDSAYISVFGLEYFKGINGYTVN